MDRRLLRTKLLDERSRLRRERIALRHEVGATGPDQTLPGYESFGQHGSDVASDVLGREIDRSIELDFDAQLAEIDDAIHRLDRGEFGRCAVCGAPIGDERLAAIPWVRRCVRHEAAVERADRRVLDPDAPASILEESTASDDEDDTATGSESAEEAALHIEREQ